MEAENGKSRHKWNQETKDKRVKIHCRAMSAKISAMTNWDKVHAHGPWVSDSRQTKTDREGPRDIASPLLNKEWPCSWAYAACKWDKAARNVPSPFLAAQCHSHRMSRPKCKGALRSSLPAYRAIIWPNLLFGFPYFPRDLWMHAVRGFTHCYHWPDIVSALHGWCSCWLSSGLTFFADVWTWRCEAAWRPCMEHNSSCHMWISLRAVQVQEVWYVLQITSDSSE